MVLEIGGISLDTQEFEKMERDGWADPGIAKGYAAGASYATRKVALALADRVAAASGQRVLDLCCGHGVVTKELVRRGAIVTGLDFSGAMIALAKEAAPEADFVEGDAMATGIRDAAFDAVTIGFGVPHLPSQESGLIESARVLRSGGRLAFSIWQGKGSAGSFGWFFDAVGRLGDTSVKLPAGPDAHMLANPEIAVGMMTRAGFQDVQLEDVSSQFWVSDPEALFDIFDKGTVRAAALLSAQSREVRDAIRAELAERVRVSGSEMDGGYSVPSPSVVVSGTRV